MKNEIVEVRHFAVNPERKRLMFSRELWHLFTGEHPNKTLGQLIGEMRPDLREYFLNLHVGGSEYYHEGGTLRLDFDYFRVDGYPSYIIKDGEIQEIYEFE